MTITTITISTVSYTSYASVLESTSYLAVDPVRSAAWALLTTDQKGANLVAATRRLDMLDWMGTKTSPSQENQWPRTGVTYPDGTAVSTTAVPIEVQNATCLLAGTIAMNSSASESGTSGNNKKRLKAGSAEIEYFRPTTGTQLQDESAFRLLRPFFQAAAATTSTVGAYASGVDCHSNHSHFDHDQDGFGLSEGYP